MVESLPPLYMRLLLPDDQNFRLFMRRVAAPVVVITTNGHGEMRGMTASSFSSLSLDPLLVSFNVTIGSQMHGAISRAQTFVVNVLSEEQAPLAALFSLPNLTSREQFDFWEHGLTGGGVPILAETLGGLQCRIVQRVLAGDHEIVIGEVEQIFEGEADRMPLLYHDRRYVRLGSPVGNEDTPPSAGPPPSMPIPKKA